MFIRNCWYVIAWDHDITADALFSRRVLNEPILLYRTAIGEIVALEDRCCHRLAPLSKGRKEGDCVRCGYHGLKFDSSGVCVEIPGYDNVPAKARVKSFPIAVKNDWVFVWMGNVGLADEALLPDNYSCRHPEWRNRPGYLHYDTNYLLICDNLLDFSHLSYVHERSLGGSAAIAQSRPIVERIDRGIRVTRQVSDVPAPAHYLRMCPFDGNVDRWWIYDFVLPGILLMQNGARPTGADPSADTEHALQMHSCQALTPETEHSTHYLFQQSHLGSQGDESITQILYDALIAAFNEDRDMITAQARMIDANPDAQMLPLGMDLALAQFRRLVDRALANERAPT